MPVTTCADTASREGRSRLLRLWRKYEAARLHEAKRAVNRYLRGLDDAALARLGLTRAAIDGEARKLSGSQR